MKKLNSQLGQLRGTDGVPHISNAAVKRGETICQHCCAREFCSEATEESKQSCAEAILPIRFNKMVGLESDFSTIRFGGAFSRRLKPGSIIGLLDTTTESVEGYAIVLEASELSKHDALTRGAMNNHTLDRSKPVKERYEKLGRTVRNSYGSYTMEPGRTFTHIECERLEDGEVKRVKETWPMGSVSKG